MLEAIRLVSILEGFTRKMPDSRGDHRESIWSLRQLSLVRYYIAFAALFSLVTGIQVWRGFATALPDQYVVDTVLAGLKEASSVTPWLIIFTYYLVEGVSMLAERYLKSRYDKGREVGKEEGREETQQQWMAWNQRREEALEAGKDFNEPPPGETEKVHK